jgi:chromosome segregation ATPase
VQEELNARIENDTKKIKACMRHLTELRTETRKINAEKDVLNIRKKELLDATSVLRADINRYHAHSKTLNKQRSLADGRISYLNDTIAYLQSMEDMLNSKMKEMNEAIIKLDIDKCNSELDVERISKISSDAEERTSIARDRMHTLLKHAKDIEEHASDAEKRVVDAEKRVAEAERMVKDIEEHASDAEKRVVDAEKRVVDAEKRVDNAEKRVVDAEKRVDDAEMRVAEAEKRANDIEEHASETEKMVIAAENEQIASREKQLKYNLNVIMNMDKYLVRSQNVMTYLRQKIIDTENDIDIQHEYERTMRVEMMNRILQTMS